MERLEALVYHIEPEPMVTIHEIPVKQSEILIWTEETGLKVEAVL